MGKWVGAHGRLLLGLRSSGRAGAVRGGASRARRDIARGAQQTPTPLAPPSPPSPHRAFLRPHVSRDRGAEPPSPHIRQVVEQERTWPLAAAEDDMARRLQRVKDTLVTLAGPTPASTARWHDVGEYASSIRLTSRHDCSSSGGRGGRERRCAGGRVAGSICAPRLRGPAPLR